MSLTHQVAKNTLFQVISKAIALVVGVVVIGLMTRYLGVFGFGEYSTIVAYLAFFGILADFGLQISVVNLMNDGRFDQGKVFSTAFTFRFLTALILFLLSSIIILAFPYSYTIKVGVWIAAIAYFALALHQLLIGLFQHHMRMHEVTIAEVSGKIFLLIATYLGVHYDVGFFWLLTLIVIASVLQTIILFAYAKRITPLKLTIDTVICKALISDSWPIAISIVFNLIYFKADTLVLSLTRSQEEVGLYSAAYRMLEVLIGYPYLFVGLLLPVLAKSWAMNDKERYARVLQKTFDALVVLAAPIVVGTILTADKIMVLIAGEKFIDSANALRILIVATGIIFVNVVFGYAIVIIKKQKSMLLGYIATAVIALTLYLTLIPRYSFIAAAWITVGAEGIMLLLNYFVSTKSSGIRVSFANAFKICVSAGIMGVVVSQILYLPFAVIVLIACTVYVALLMVMRIITKELITSLVRSQS